MPPTQATVTATVLPRVPRSHPYRSCNPLSFRPPHKCRAGTTTTSTNTRYPSSSTRHPRRPNPPLALPPLPEEIRHDLSRDFWKPRFEEEELRVRPSPNLPTTVPVPEQEGITDTPAATRVSRRYVGDLPLPEKSFEVLNFCLRRVTFQVLFLAIF